MKRKDHKQYVIKKHKNVIVNIGYFLYACIKREVKDDGNDILLIRNKLVFHVQNAYRHF